VKIAIKNMPNTYNSALDIASETERREVSTDEYRYILKVSFESPPKNQPDTG
jgi:hypothetical protein